MNLGIPHFTNEEDVYRDFRIPKNSIVISNLFAMLHDEQHYPDPDTFNPDRHIMIGPDGKMKINPDVMAPENIVFGFGRRECPGQHMAYASVWATVALTLSAFRIEKRVKPDGTVIEPSYAYGTLLGLYVILYLFFAHALTLSPASPSHSNALSNHDSLVLSSSSTTLKIYS